MQARHFEPVRKDDSETVTALEAERRQPTGNARDLLIPGRIAEPPLAVDDRGHLGAALDRSKKGPAQIKHWKNITSRRRAEASGRFRLRAAPAGVVIRLPRSLDSPSRMTPIGATAHYAARMRGALTSHRTDRGFKLRRFRPRRRYTYPETRPRQTRRCADTHAAGQYAPVR